MTEILNLDNLLQEVRELSWKGKVYEMKVPSVSDFITNTKKAEKAEAARKKADAGEMKLSEVFELMIDLVSDNFPTLPVEEIEKMNLDQLNAVLGFIRGSVVEDIVNDEKGSAAEAGAAVSEKK